MTRPFVPLVACVLLALGVAPAQAAGQDAKRPPKELWDEFPLEPSATPTAAAPEATSTPRVVRVEDDGGIAPGALLVLMVAAAGIGAVAARFATQRLPRSVPKPVANAEPKPAVASHTPAAAKAASRPSGKAKPPRARKPAPTTARATKATPEPSRRSGRKAKPKPETSPVPTPSPAPNGTTKASRQSGRKAKPKPKTPPAPIPAPVQDGTPEPTRRSGRKAKPKPETARKPTAAPAQNGSPKPTRRVGRKEKPDVETSAAQTAKSNDAPDRSRSADPKASPKPAPKHARSSAQTARQSARRVGAQSSPGSERPPAQPPGGRAENGGQIRRFVPADATQPSAAMGRPSRCCSIILAQRPPMGRFVAVADAGGRVLARSPVFRLKRAKEDTGITPPDALQALVEELIAAGWRKTGAGRAPWELQFERMPQGAVTPRASPPRA